MIDLSATGVTGIPLIPDGKYFPEHEHDWMIKDDNVRYRDQDENEFVIDTYVCECGAGGSVKTPKAMFDKGLKVYGISND